MKKILLTILTTFLVTASGFYIFVNFNNNAKVQSDNNNSTIINQLFGYISVTKEQPPLAQQSPVSPVPVVPVTPIAPVAPVVQSTPEQLPSPEIQALNNKSVGIKPTKKSAPITRNRSYQVTEEVEEEECCETDEETGEITYVECSEEEL